MTKTFNVPFLFILIFLISKEVFSYDSEKIVILCILCFLITAYYNLRTSLYETFQSISSKIEEEFLILVELRAKLENNIKNFWENYLKLEDQLIEIYFWVKSNFKAFINKANKNRILFNFHIVKDQLNSLVKDTLNTQYLFESVYKAIILNNFYFMLDSKINSSPVKLETSTFFEKLKSKEESFTFEELILNKLNINKEIILDNNKDKISKYNLETLKLLNIKLS